MSDDATATGPPAQPDDRSQLIKLAPGRMWVSDLGPERPGAEPPLVLLHSLLVTGWDFRFVADPLAAAGRRVVIPDLFGCGSSDRPAPADAAGYGFRWHAELVARMLDHLFIGEIDLVGHGFGASVAIHLARRLGLAHADHSASVRRLALIAPYCLPVAAPIALPGPMPLVRRIERWIGFAPLVFRTVFRRADLRRFLLRSLSTPELLDSQRLGDDLDVYWDRLCRDGGLEAVEAMLGQIDALHGGERGGVREQLHAAARSLAGDQTLVVWGDRDEIVPTASQAERAAALIPGADLRIVEGCGHAPHRERPAELLRVLEGFDRRL